MKKKYLIVLFLVAEVICAFMYVRSYQIRGQMNIAVGHCSSESPSGDYWITLHLYPVSDTGDLRPMIDTGYMSFDDLRRQIERGELETYIVGRLRWDPEVKPSRIIWNAENGRAFIFGKYNGEPSTITWLDDHTAVINGIRLYVPLMIVGGYVVDALTIMHTWGVLL